MLYMLDTNICIFLISKKKPFYFDKLDELQIKNNSRIAISTIVLAELQYGIANSQHQEQNQSTLNILLGKLEILPYSEECAFFYGTIRASLKKAGHLIGGNDLLIASRVDGLIVEHWE
jgi:tRNA(fMet)-specific endonuclease VapC